MISVTLISATVLSADKLAAQTTLATAEQRESQATLRSHGLRIFGQSTVWVVSAEAKFRSLHRSTLNKHQDLTRARQQVQELIAANSKRRSNNQPAIRKLQAQAKRISESDPQYASIQRKITQLQSSSVAADRVGNNPKVREAVVHWINLRNEIRLATDRCIHLATESKAGYAELSVNAKVSAAIKTLGGANRIGPVVDDFAVRIEQLRAAVKDTKQLKQPAYLLNDLPRFSGILNERTPVTFSLRNDTNAIILTHSAAHSAGLLSESNSQTRVRLDGKTHRCYPVRIRYLAFGPHELQDVPALILPAESEDVGCILGQRSLEGYQIIFNSKSLWIDFRATQQN